MSFIFSLRSWKLVLIHALPKDDFYNDWSERYHNAVVVLEDGNRQIEAVSNEIEQDLCFLCATAIKDCLQDGVPKTTANLKFASIKVWVATGDKLETDIGEFFTHIGT